MSNSSLKSNLSLTSTTSNLGLKSNLLLTSSLVSNRSTALTSSTLSSPLASKVLSNSLIANNGLKGIKSEEKQSPKESNTATTLSSSLNLKRLTPNLSLELDIKKLKVSDNLLSSQNSSLLRSTLNKVSSHALANNNKFLNQSTSHASNSILSKTSFFNTQKTNIPEKSYFHLDSESDMNEDYESFIADELTRTQSLIQQISGHNEDFYALSRRLKPVRLNTFNEQLSLKEKPAILIYKSLLVNTVSAALLNQPDFTNPKDPTRALILSHADNIVLNDDPEFIVKLALYTRRELNIRVVANFLLCLASFKPECRPYLRRYFNESIVLPSDWIDVAEQYQLFTDKRINYGALPHALRKVMVEKFPDFDQYQLAKYNKEKSRMGKNKKIQDLKHIKSKLKEDEEKSDSVNSNLVEDKYIKVI
jgi:hypothetical protein